jgi:uncharacterized membrane protein YkoI
VQTARAFHFHYNGAMKMTRALQLAILCLVVLAGAGMSPAAIASDHGRSRGDARVMADRGISLDEAVARAERRHEARVVRAEERRRGDRIVYRIRLLGSDGRVFEVTVDAETGREH